LDNGNSGMDSDLGIIVRDAVLTDLDSIQKIESVFGEEAFERRTLRRFILGNNPVLVLEDSGELIGYAILAYRRNSISSRLYSIAVAVPGKGYGSWLLSAAIDRSLRDRKAKLTLEVDVNNRAGIALYRKYGFTIQRELSSYYTSGNSAYKMVLET